MNPVVGSVQTVVALIAAGILIFAFAWSYGGRSFVERLRRESVQTKPSHSRSNVHHIELDSDMSDLSDIGMIPEDLKRRLHPVDPEIT